MRFVVGVVTVAAIAAMVTAVAPKRRVIELPAGVVELHHAMRVDSATEVRGRGTVLRMAADFADRAAIEVGDGAYLRDFTIEGNLAEQRAGLPAYDTPFVRFTRGNGIVADGVSGLRIENVRFRRIAGFAVLASRSRDVSIDRVQVSDCGSRNSAGKNNTTGGILLEEGTADWRVTRSEFRNVLGNGVWTHSLYTSPRNARGLIAGNVFDTVGRDAVQVGHATSVRVEENSGKRIGFSKEAVDAQPVGIDTAGNVDASVYARNRFEEVNGKCIDLDGFHDGEVRGNVCLDVAYGIVMNNTNPDMQSQNIRIVENTIDGSQLGGVFVIGTGNLVARNRLLRLNTLHCDSCVYLPDEPEMLRSGIYLGRRAERPGPARGNTIEDNEVTGYRMKERCVERAPGIGSGWNVVRRNTCR
jgi:hypothetical protein